MIALFLGGLLIIVNINIHALALDLIIRHFSTVGEWLNSHIKILHKPLMASLGVLCVFCSHILQIWIWAAVYLALPGVPLNDTISALYFSTTTMTTLGYGDIVLQTPWNLLSAIEGANGFIAFGWSTAFTFEMISQLYRKEARSIK